MDGAQVADQRPALAPYPGPQRRESLPPVEWQACLDGWLFGLEYRLRLNDKDFNDLEVLFREGDLAFIKSYISARPSSANHGSHSTEARLYQRTYLLLRRLLLSTKTVPDVGAQIIVDLVIPSGQVFQSNDFPRLAAALSTQHPKQFFAGLDLWKANRIRDITNHVSAVEITDTLQSMNAFLRGYAEAGAKLMTGADYLEALMELYRQNSRSSSSDIQQQTVIEHLFLCLRSLMSDKARHPSLLLDQLYVLRTDADRLGMKKAEVATLLSGLLCTTNFLRHLAGDAAVMDTKRGQDMLDALMAYREQTRQLFPVPPRRKTNIKKGKGRADDREDMHIHQAAQVSQIQELFPDLSAGHIMRLLDHFNDDVEMTTAALLEPATLPQHLQDPTDQVPEGPAAKAEVSKARKPSIVPTKQSVFDGDDFDRLKISSKQLHKGRRKMTINDPELPEEKNRSKAATLAALAAIETDDDEADDTYNEADVGGSIDQSVDTDERSGQFEEILYRAWKGNTALFARDSKTRISPTRQDLKRQTGMSDEQIEGWAIMLARDAALQRRLQQKYSVVNTFRGNQLNVESTSWRKSASAENSMDESDDYKQDTGDESGTGDGLSPSNSIRGRGRGRGGASRGENHPTSDRSRGRGRGRGGRANHNRREGRARKMGRGMAGGAP